MRIYFLQHFLPYLAIIDRLYLELSLLVRKIHVYDIHHLVLFFDCRCKNMSSEAFPIFFSVTEAEIVCCEIVLRSVLDYVVDESLRTILTKPVVEAALSLWGSISCDFDLVDLIFRICENFVNRRENLSESNLIIENRRINLCLRNFEDDLQLISSEIPLSGSISKSEGCRDSSCRKHRLFKEGHSLGECLICELIFAVASDHLSLDTEICRFHPSLERH